MVKRYEFETYFDGSEIVEQPIGEWVKHSDYAALQDALKEALERWKKWATAFAGDAVWGADHDLERIAELRKQFLE